MGKKRGFGQIRNLPSGRIHARYTGPDGQLHNAPATFEDRDAAVIWLNRERQLVEADTWTSPTERQAVKHSKGITLGEYSERWLKARKVRGRQLAARTRDHYQSLLDRFILPEFGAVPMKQITPEAVAHWYDTAMVGIPTTQAHAYSLLKSIMATAADPSASGGRPLIPYNPCGIRGGGSSPTTHRKVDLPTAAEVRQLAVAMPGRHRLMVLLADDVGLRFGELVALRRRDVKLPSKKAEADAVPIIKVREGVSRSQSEGVKAGRTKSAAGIRDVYPSPALMPLIRGHLERFAEPGPDGLLFPGRDGAYLAPSTFYGRATGETKRRGKVKEGWGWYEARRVADRPDLRFHDLRHGALTKAAQLGATVAELMDMAGHSTNQASLRYQQAASTRMEELARLRASKAEWTPTVKELMPDE